MKKQPFFDEKEVRERLLFLHSVSGSWGKVSKLLKIPKGTVYGIAVKGKIPHNDELRAKLGMGPLCTHCNRPPRKRRKRILRIRNMSKKALLWALENREEMK